MPTDEPLDHRRLDRRSLALHRAVAGRLRERPDLLAVAHHNLDRWEKNASARSVPVLREWREILTSWPLARVLELLVAESEEADRLRQSSPFAGVLQEEERLEIFREFAAGR